MSSLSPKAPDTPRKSNRSVLLLTMTALGAILFTFAGGLFVFHNTQQFDASVEWLEHTHGVIDLLMQQSTRIDRTEAGMQLYEATSDDGDKREAAARLVSLNAGVLRLQDMVPDNPSQTRHAKALAMALQALSQAVDSSPRERTIPNAEIRECRNILNLMLNEERGLLEQRTKDSKQTLLRSNLSSTVFAGMSLVVLMPSSGCSFGMLSPEGPLRPGFRSRIATSPPPWRRCGYASAKRRC